MKKELVALLDYWEKNKGISKEFLIASLEEGLSAVYRKKAMLQDNIEVKIDPETGDINFVDENGNSVTPPSFPWERIAAQTAKQILIQKIREAEKAAIYSEFKKLENTIISGRIERFETGNLVISVARIEALLPQKHLLPRDRFHLGDPIKALLLEVRKPNKGVYPIILSRTATDFAKRLLMDEIPEIRDGIVEIKAIARFPGDLTKIAVYSSNPKVDPVGTCIGDKANRIKNITKELSGEKIEVVKWSSDPEKFTASALLPAVCERVVYDPTKNEATVWVSKDQLFVAIGKKGQNVRLACKLTGWNIVVNRAEGEGPATLLLGISEELAQKLSDAGYETIKSVSEAKSKELSEKINISEDHARELIEAATRQMQDAAGDKKIDQTENE
ncbi:MAG: transcription termination factor NusA [Candidatus Omnitrophica bacterium]|nr:transcription termination factor NusA [Candidatus Omnitrophota bacterium]MCM8827766.1 transcription termination factor NusA [Candidatus Omnitrophota bacterium]